MSSGEEAIEPSDLDAAVAAAANLVGQAERVAVLTGAGISTDSRIPDFRGPQGVWTKNPGAEKQSTIQNYVADPEIRKRAWMNRLDSPVWGAEPNRGHEALLGLERQKNSICSSPKISTGSTTLPGQIRTGSLRFTETFGRWSA